MEKKNSRVACLVSPKCSRAAGNSFAGRMFVTSDLKPVVASDTNDDSMELIYAPTQRFPVIVKVIVKSPVNITVTSTYIAFNKKNCNPPMPYSN